MSEPVKDQQPATQPPAQPQSPAATQPPEPAAPIQPAAPAPPKEEFDMDRIPYTQGTRAYQAAQAVLRVETDNKTTAADTRLNLKNVQNIRSMIGRLRKSGAIPMSNLTSEATVVNTTPPPLPPPPVLPPVSPVTPVTPVTHSPGTQPTATQLPIREHVPAQPARQEGKEVMEGKERTEGNGRESSQEGDGRESLGKKSPPSPTLGKDIREAKEGMRLVKDSQVGSYMEGGMPMGGLMDQELARATTLGIL